MTEHVARVRGWIAAIEADEDAPCPYCSTYVPVDRLCEHDDHETGPLCLDRCCERAHPVGLKLWEVPTADLKGLSA